MKKRLEKKMKKRQMAKAVSKQDVKISAAQIQAEAVKVEAPKAEEPKAVESKVETLKAVEPKAEAPKAVKSKVEEPKAEEPAGKKNAEASVGKNSSKINIFYQFYDHQVEQQEIITMIKSQWKDQGNKIKDLKDLVVYLKPEEKMAYYVINENIKGSVAIGA